MNAVSQLFKNVKKFPDKIAIIYREEEISYFQLWQNIQIRLNILKSRGFQKGDKVALFLPNGVEFVYFFYAILMGGGIFIPVDPSWRQYELKIIMSNCRPSFVITEKDLWGKATSDYKFDVKVISLAQIMRKNGGSCIENIEHLPSNTIASIHYTYNGSGYPKGAELSHRNYLYVFLGLPRHLGLTKEDVYMFPIPMAHVLSLASGYFVPLLLGATIVITDSYFPNTILSLIENHKVTILTSVASLFALLVRAFKRRKQKNNSLRFMISGGEYMSQELNTLSSKEFNVPIVQGYGLTECMPVFCDVPDGSNKPESIGTAVRKDILVKIVNSSMQEVEVGEIGEILIKSPSTMKGYHRLPTDTKDVFFQGWLKTGDIGRIDNDGFLYFERLKKRIFNLSGLKVDPAELESVSKLHPDIRDVKISVRTIDGMLPRKVLMAEVFLNDGVKVSEKELEDFYKTQLAEYKIPKHIIIRE